MPLTIREWSLCSYAIQQLFIISVPCNEGSMFTIILTPLWVDNLIISFPEFHVLFYWILGANIIGFSQNGFVMFPSKQCIEWAL